MDISEFVKPYAIEIMAALTAGAVAYIRAKVQRLVAVEAAADQEREECASLPGSLKKAQAMQHVKVKLPIGLRPLTQAGLDKLVESAVPEGKKRRAKAKA